MKTLIYDLLLIIYLILFSPLLILKIIKGKYRKSFIKRFSTFHFEALVKKINFNTKIVWIHAVSVGEVNSITGLVKELKRDKKISVIVTTVTETGNEYALKKCPEADVITYLPFDFSWLIKGFFSVFRPSCLVIAETEIWPNLLWSAGSLNIPVVFVNGRISNKTHKTYTLFSWIFRDVLRDVNYFLMQDSDGVDRVISAGAVPKRVVIGGNFKYDSLPAPDEKTGQEIYKLIKSGADKTQPIITIASTHPGEDELLCRIILENAGQVNLVIVPRHVERSIKLKRMFKELFSKEADLRSSNKWKKGNILIVDSIGELIDVFKMSDLVIMGGSFSNIGGHNILEPAACGVPVIYGWNMSNFIQEEKLLNNNGAICAENEKRLAELIHEFIDTREKYRLMGIQGLKCVNSLRGAVKKGEFLIKDLLFQRS